ncbi:SusD/RagB family nutrient-binding outer membrane lipoprotein [Mucilaginibacter polytrichastri]|uniref:SusD/RagB family nutrient-binding outer membrane lipoprotein n=1 Tax=Mucilaginibacter polytrichastri TaxID=1302689 RepID=A0A1Q5ZZG4_9SPHI|nr:SusD/RagB family nutrient-binding outer membrane lipoprotein [Mucilaginibacter polytrichastri]OKS87141.1 hypothetical protein RG47T_2600 [Mucilaginibacter polytrichastri]SFS87991.1 Starch-binding associating with outer membrane [Mucilaginibacter polytrichastri]
MKIRSYIIPLALAITGMVSFTGCQKGDLVANPNVSGANALVPPPLLLNALTATLIRQSELPWGSSALASQYVVSNYAYYRSSNSYNFGNTTDSYDILKYAIKLQQQAVAQQGNSTNKYYALAQFFKAYAGIWLTQRVGDIPFSQAGDATNLTPKYDTQHDVYQSALTLLDNANTLLGNLITTTPALSSTVLDTNDIFGFTYLQWQKLINTYRLRVLISLSKRAADNADLQIPQQFATIIGNPTKYPIMTSNTDNMILKSTTVSRYSIFSLNYNPYNNYANIGNAYLSITTANLDPRTYLSATPAPIQLVNGKTVSDFTAYVGSSPNTAQGTLLSNASAGSPAYSQSPYSFANYNRYYTSNVGANAEPFVFIGYPELCFNIAEAVNRGWVGGSASTWYNNGITASFGVYGLTNGQSITIGDLAGKTLGTVTVNIPQFLTKVAYSADPATGLKQIWTQKYTALFNNSGWEGFYLYLRTGVPALDQGGAGIGTPNSLISRRWMYPATEAVYNAANYKAAITSQYGGTDDMTKDMWLYK